MGERIAFGGGYYTHTAVCIYNPITLFAETLVLSKSQPIGDGALCLQDNCLKITESAGYVQIPVIGNIEEGATSRIICEASGQLEFCEKVQVYEMDVPQNVLLRSEYTIVHLRADSCAGVTIYGGAGIIENLHDANILLIQNGSAHISNLYSDQSGQINIFLQFGKIEEFPSLTLGNIECNVELVLDGEVQYLTTDLGGNELDRWVEKLNPTNVNMVAHLLRKFDFDKIKISYSNMGEKTSLYTIDSNGDIVLKPHEVQNGMIIMDSRVVHYDDSAKVLTIPDGVTTIERYAINRERDFKETQQKAPNNTK